MKHHLIRNMKDYLVERQKHRTIYHFTESYSSLQDILDSDSLQSGSYNGFHGRGYDNISFTWNSDLWNLEYAGDEEPRYKARIAFNYDLISKDHTFVPFDYGIEEEQEEIIEAEIVEPIKQYITEISVSTEISSYLTEQLRHQFPDLKINRVRSIRR
jgi:hypothetical protein